MNKSRRRFLKGVGAFPAFLALGNLGGSIIPESELYSEIAKKIAADTLNRNLYPVTFVSRPGLLNTIAFEIRKQNPAANIFICTGESFLDLVVNSIFKKSTYRLREQLLAADVFILKDVDFLGLGDVTQEEFLRVLAEFERRGKRVVLSSNRAPDKIVGLKAQVSERLKRGMVL